MSSLKRVSKSEATADNYRNRIKKHSEGAGGEGWRERRKRQKIIKLNQLDNCSDTDFGVNDLTV